MGELTFTVIGVFRERVETFGLRIFRKTRHPPFTLMKYLHRHASGAFAGLCKQRERKTFHPSRGS